MLKIICIFVIFQIVFIFARTWNSCRCYFQYSVIKEKLIDFHSTEHTKEWFRSFLFTAGYVNLQSRNFRKRRIHYLFYGASFYDPSILLEIIFSVCTDFIREHHMHRSGAACAIEWMNFACNWLNLVVERKSFKYCNNSFLKSMTQAIKSKNYIGRCNYDKNQWMPFIWLNTIENGSSLWMQFHLFFFIIHISMQFNVDFNIVELKIIVLAVSVDCHVSFSLQKYQCARWKCLVNIIFRRPFNWHQLNWEFQSSWMTTFQWKYFNIVLTTFTSTKARSIVHNQKSHFFFQCQNSCIF